MVRRRVIGKTRPRLCVFRSSKHIYAQVIDDSASRTLASASSREPGMQVDVDGKVAVASAVGSLVARRAMEKGVSKVVFDRRNYKYHGRVKALAEAAREAGLEF